MPSCPIDIKSQHRHRGAEGFGFAAPAGLRGLLERSRDFRGIGERKYASLQIEGVTRFGYVLRPAAILRRRFFRFLLTGHAATCCDLPRHPGFQVTDYVDGFIHPADIALFVFYAQTGHLAFAAAGNQFGIVVRVERCFLERNF